MSDEAGPGAPAATGLLVETVTAPGAGPGSWGHSTGQGGLAALGAALEGFSKQPGLGDDQGPVGVKGS